MKKFLFGLLVLVAGLGAFTAKADYYLARGKDGGIDLSNKNYPFTDTNGKGTDFVLKIDVLEKGENFKITDGISWDNSYGGSENKNFDLDKQFSMIKGSGSKSIYTPYTIYNAVINLHIGNTFWIKVEGTPAPYIIGDWYSGQDPNWNIDTGILMEPVSDDLKTWTCRWDATRSGNTYNYFRFLINNVQYGPNSSTEHTDLELDEVFTSYKDKTNKTFRYNQAGTYFITLYLNDTDNPTFKISDKPTLPIKGVYSIYETSEAWSYRGIEFEEVVSISLDSDVPINPEFIDVSFLPGSNSSEDWLEGDGRPDGLYDAEWEVWQIIENAGFYTDGYWDASKVVASLEPTSNPNTFTIKALLPCSGRYKVVLSSEYYDLSTKDETDCFLTAYPSIKNVWVSDDFVTDDGTYLPICFNINGVPLNLNSNNDDLEGYGINYPFIRTDEESDGNSQVILNFENLHKSVVYIPGVYFADIWIMVTPVGAELESYRNARRNADTNLDDYTNGQTIDLSGLATEDGSKPGSNYRVSVVLSKNGATTPRQNDNSSEEVFIISPSTSAPLPTGIDTVGGEEGSQPQYFNLQGVKVNNPTHGIFIMIKNGKSSKIVL